MSLGPGPGSVAGRYSNFTSGPGAPAAPSITQGLNYTAAITIQSCNTTNRGSAISIFVDYNQDLDFADPGEKVWNTPLATNFNSIPGATLYGSFTVPLTATPGVTRLRVMNTYSTSGPNTTPCTNSSYGETEDYLVNIVLAPPVDLSIIAQPLPSSAGCYSTAETVQVTVYNQASQTINFATTPATVSASVTGPNAAVFTPVVINTGTLAVGATLNVNITGTYNMGAAGTYQFTSSVAVAGDANSTNDTLGPITHIFNAGYALTPGYGIVCEGSPSNIPLLGLTPSGCTVQWQQSPDNVTWTNIIGQTSLSMTAPVMDTMFYRVIACGLIASVSDTVFTADLTVPPVTMNDTLCGVGTMTVSATVNAGTVHWFNSSVGGTELGAGPTYTTSVAATQTFWAENQLNDCGQSSIPVAPTCYPEYAYGCSSGDQIKNFFTTGGVTNISNLNSGCGGSLPTNTAFYPNQAVTVAPGGTFNVTAEALGPFAQTFSLWIDYNNDGDFADAGEHAWSSGPSVPGPIPHSGSITVPASTGVGPKRIRISSTYLTVLTASQSCPQLTFGETEEYTLIVCTSCNSPRSPAIASYNTGVPVSVVSSNDICGAQTATLTASSSNTSYTYSWSPSSTLNASTGPTVISSASVSTTYTVTGTDTAGCVYPATVLVNYWHPPVLTATASDFIICTGDSTILSAGHPATSSQITVGVHNQANTAFSFPAPYGNFNWGSKHQFVIRASELTAAGMVAGYMGSLTFDIISTNSSQPLQNFEISLGAASSNVMSGFQSVPMTTVFTAASFMPFAGLNTHVFSTAYYWDGVSDLLIQTCHNNSSASFNCTFKLTQMPYACCTYFGNSALGVCNSTTSTANVSRRPVMRFNMLYTTGWSYVWTPPATLSSPTSASTSAGPSVPETYSITITDLHGCTATQTVAISVTAPPPSFSLGPDPAVCAGNSVTFSGPAGPYDYLWNTSDTTMNITTSTSGNYVLVITDPNSGCSKTDTAVFTVNPLPPVNFGPDFAVCSADLPTNLNAPSGNYTYQWNTSDTTASISVTSGGTYAVIITDNQTGCMNSDSVAVTVNVSPTATLSLTIDTVCLNAGAIMLSGESPAGGTWSGTAVSGNMFDPMVAGVGTFGITYTYLDSNGCPALAVDSLLVDACLDAGATSAATGFSLYPNPTAGIFVYTAEGLNAAEVHMEIIAADGKLVCSRSVTPVNGRVKEEFDLTAYANGIYLLRITTDTKQQTHRITRQE